MNQWSFFISIFEKQESVEDFNEDFIGNELRKIKYTIEELKRELPEEEGNVEGYRKIAEKIEKMEDNKDSIVDHKRSLRLILSVMDQIRSEIKEDYLQRTIKNTLIMLFNEIVHNYFPFIDIMKDKYQLALKSN